MISAPKLQSIKGRVITPADAEYDSARAVFNGGVDKRPAMIVRVADAADVARAIALARDGGLELAVRAGGHSPAGYSVSDGGVVIDLRDMRGLEIDAARRVADAQTGLTAVEYSKAASAHGLATGFGDTGSVGIAGLTLGGGIGYLVRKYGMTIDDLISADIVTADGELRHVDAETDPDLFWAIRGGGGNFGVATRFRLRLHEVPDFTGGMLVLPATPDTVQAFLAEAAAAAEELTTLMNVMPAPPMPFLAEEHHGKLVILAFIAFAGPAAGGERVLAKLRAIATPLADLVRPIPYHEIYPPDDPNYRPRAAGRTMFVDTIDRRAIDTIFERLNASDASMRVAHVRVLGGAMARVRTDATAFAHRNRKYMVAIAALYERPEDKERHQVWADSLAEAIGFKGSGAYVNFLADEGEARIRAAYPGATWDRLRKVKARHDPDNVFRMNQNIPPA